MRNKFPNGITTDIVFEKYHNTVYRLALARTQNISDAEDIVQTVFLRLVGATTVFNDEEHIKAWLIKVTVNASKNLMLSSWMRLTSPLDENISTQMAETGEVYHAVMKLPVKYRTAIHLFYYEGYTCSQIADLLNTNEATIKTRLKRAREKLKLALKGEDFDV